MHPSKSFKLRSVSTSLASHLPRIQEACEVGLFSISRPRTESQQEQCKAAKAGNQCCKVRPSLREEPVSFWETLGVLVELALQAHPHASDGEEQHTSRVPCNRTRGMLLLQLTRFCLGKSFRRKSFQVRSGVRRKCAE